ncbi:MAG: hypothetical protein II719_05685 [Clostridia bacterium]|nr:hypothetical protein [Clostridia bacterium]
MKRISFALLLLSAVFATAGCGSAAGANNPDPGFTEKNFDTAPGSSPETEALSSAADYSIPEPDLPELDFGEGPFIIFAGKVGQAGILTWLEDLDYENLLFPASAFLSSEGLTGEVVNDAVYNRNLMVEEKFNLRFQIEKSEIRCDEPILAGEPIDLVLASGTVLAETALSGVYENMSSIPYLDLTAEYWSPRCLEGTVVDSLVFMMPSDICLDPLVHTGILFFNKRILSENDLENPYDMVRQNTWTLENFLNLVRSVHKDLNGNGTMDVDDLFGGLFRYEWRDGAWMQFYFGAGQTYTRIDKDLGRTLAFNPEIGQGIIDRLYEVLEDRRICMDFEDVEKLGGPELYDQIFLEGRSLFCQHFITSTDVFREMEDDFGIVPNPKYDSDQDRYYQRVDPGSGMFSIPVTTPSVEKTGAVAEYMSWLSHNTVLPAYYEITIKTKRVRDEDAVEMLDIIRNSRVFEFGDLYQTRISHYVWDAYVFRSFPQRVSANEKLLGKAVARYVSRLRSLE